MSNENTNATSTKKRTRDNDLEGATENPPVSILKRSRIEKTSSNLSRVKFGHENRVQNQSEKLSKAQTKMMKRLEPITRTLASLPLPLATQVKAFATLILSRKIEIIHCEKRTRFHEKNPHFYPSSTRFEFKLTCKEEYANNEIFKEQKEKAKAIVEETKKSLRETILSVHKMEEEGSKTKFMEDFMKGTLDIFELYSCYTRTADKSIELPYDDNDASEILLISFFHDYCTNLTLTNKNYFEFLHSSKIDIMRMIAIKKQKIPYFNREIRETEDITASNLFLTNARKDFFPLIDDVTIDLVNNYIKTQDKEEALQKTAALLSNKTSRSITIETSDALQNEPSINPKSMQELIDDRITLTLRKKEKSEKRSNSISKKSQTNNDNNTKNKTSKNSKGPYKNQIGLAAKQTGSPWQKTTKPKKQTSNPTSSHPSYHQTKPYPNQRQRQEWNPNYHKGIGRGTRGRGRGRSRGGRGEHARDGKRGRGC